MKTRDMDFERHEWVKLIKAADNILGNASRDILMWTKIKEQAEAQLKLYPEEKQDDKI